MVFGLSTPTSLFSDFVGEEVLTERVARGEVGDGAGEVDIVVVVVRGGEGGKSEAEWSWNWTGVVESSESRAEQVV